MSAILNDRTGPVEITYKPLWWTTANDDTYGCYAGSDAYVLVAHAVLACFMLGMWVFLVPCAFIIILQGG